MATNHAAAIAIALLAFAGCAATTGGGGHVAATQPVAAHVTGTVTYRERIALPPHAVITVTLADISRADARATVIGKQLIEASGRQVPFQFDIAYDPAKIDPRYTYAIQARIEQDGKLRFISDQHYAVITRGAPSHVDMVLRQVGTPR